MGKIDKAVQWAINIANDNSHGYSMSNRWGTPDYDCSSFVISAWQDGAGVPVKTYGASYTGNMLDPFLACGFTQVKSADLIYGRNLKKGDVLLNIQCHTCMYIGNGMVVNCRTDVDGVAGDGDGNEIRLQPYWNYPWDVVLRYKEDSDDQDLDPVDPSDPEQDQDEDPKEILLPYDTVGIGVAGLQGMLKYLGYDLGYCGIDGDNGGQYSYTNTALETAVSEGQISKETVEYLKNLC